MIVRCNWSWTGRGNPCARCVLVGIAREMGFAYALRCLMNQNCAGGG